MLKLKAKHKYWTKLKENKSNEKEMIFIEVQTILAMIYTLYFNNKH